jgi:hypothetical protein
MNSEDRETGDWRGHGEVRRCTEATREFDGAVAQGSASVRPLVWGGGAEGRRSCLSGQADLSLLTACLPVHKSLLFVPSYFLRHIRNFRPIRRSAVSSSANCFVMVHSGCDVSFQIQFNLI